MSAYRGPYGDNYCHACEKERGERYHAKREEFNDALEGGGDSVTLRRLQREADGLVDACICEEPADG